MTPEETRRAFVECTKPIQEHLNRYTDEEFIQAIDRSLESIERSALSGFGGIKMNREEMLEEMNELGTHIISAVHGATFIPMSYVRRYNDLVRAVFGDEDPEIKEANEDGRES